MNTAEILETIHRRVDISGVRADVSMEELRKLLRQPSTTRLYLRFCASLLYPIPSELSQGRAGYPCGRHHRLPLRSGHHVS